MKAAWYLFLYMMIHERFYNVYILGGKCALYMVSTWHVAPCHGYMAIHKFGFFANASIIAHSSTTAKSHWDQLAAQFESKGEQHIIHLINEIFWGTLSDSEPTPSTTDECDYTCSQQALYTWTPTPRQTHHICHYLLTSFLHECSKENPFQHQTLRHDN
jgi:hypothetical protein